MTASQSLKLFQIASKYFNNQDDATNFVNEIEAVVDNKFEQKENVLATKQYVADVKADLMKAIYFTGLIQFLAIVGSVLAIITFVFKK